MRVLVAEDDAASKLLLRTMLTKWGYEVAVATDGLAARDALFADDAPRLAILDWMMPGMDGPQVCRAVRKRDGQNYTYVILLTAKSSKQDMVEGMESGADDYLTKPFDPSELRVRIRAGERLLDLHSELLSMRESLVRQATHDTLTGLPNRLLFADRLSQSLAHARRYKHSLAVMFLDLDRFKLINDSLGHGAGDELLKQVAERLKGRLKDADTVARMGGDEFTIILTGVSSVSEVAEAARAVSSALADVFWVENREIFASASLGISIYPGHGDDAETLVRNADAAMYQAKENGGNTFLVYAESFNSRAVERMTLDNNLRRAVEGEEFELHYQPQVDLFTGQTLGAEALIRWRCPNVGLIAPTDFIPLAEENGLIWPISGWVLRTACAQRKAWHDAGLPPFQVSVNISPRVFVQQDLLSSVTQALEETGLPGELLNVEITESALMHNVESASALLGKLKDLGVKISLDDFGTGYSSLAQLKHYPFDSVKIDQSFIKDIAVNPDDAAITGAIIAMGHSLKLTVVAEGVETLEQLRFLQKLGCDQMQGYFVSRPVPADGFPELLSQTYPAAPLRMAA
ncbi:MAG: EAL domain-containing protein [Armatimonadota bacterium]|nr:EAL domain-containing protein [Armatimonadota bacterium]